MAILRLAHLEKLAEQAKDLHVPGCNCAGTMTIYARCHPEECVRVKYTPLTGYLLIVCGKCDEEVIKIQISR
jgi:hypothetical protein